MHLPNEGGLKPRDILQREGHLAQIKGYKDINGIEVRDLARISSGTFMSWFEFTIVESTIVRKMGAVFIKEELSDFQKNKLLHEFHTFFDLNKDGVLEWKDFEMAREQICKKSGWKIGTDEHTRTKAVFCDIWRHLQDDGDLNLDGRITSEEWVRMWEKLNKEYHVKKRERKNEEAEEPIPSWQNIKILRSVRDMSSAIFTPNNTKQKTSSNNNKNASHNNSTNNSNDSYNTTTTTTITTATTRKQQQQQQNMQHYRHHQ
ncbi:sarcoplasmic calcium-binding proteins i, iii, and iv-like [Plakobranchus ocellatus]|uniref:Sarcoplasmic calcium-binding proteins i, iii, and iv-like n=1 Tax=Plakobranchus ocellatus TaxID=259542 RepID=A0AAV3Z2I6_9GAST|nr:sarcoplasmic calcium-binding proteins i, iii, and iv-like [Plakobranchus ocellatus]